MMIHCHSQICHSFLKHSHKKIVELLSEANISSCNEAAKEMDQSVGPESIQPSKSRCSADFSFFQLLQTPPSDKDKLKFLTENEGFDPVINSIVSPVVNLPSPLRDLYRPENEELTYPELLAVCEQVTVTITDDDVKIIEAATRHQSKSTPWFAQRAGRITASVMKNVCVTDPGNPSLSDQPHLLP